jgi:hypothetical protein
MLNERCLQDPYYNPVPARIIRKIPGNGPVTDLSLIEFGMHRSHFAP